MQKANKRNIHIKKQDNLVEAEFSKHLYNLWYLVYLGILVHTQCKIVHTLNLDELTIA